MSATATLAQTRMNLRILAASAAKRWVTAACWVSAVALPHVLVLGALALHAGAAAQQGAQAAQAQFSVAALALALGYLPFGATAVLATTGVGRRALGAIRFAGPTYLVVVHALLLAVALLKLMAP